MSIDIPDKVVERAAALGVPVSALVSQALEQIVQVTEEPIPAGFGRLGASTRSLAEATKSIR